MALTQNHFHPNFARAAALFADYASAEEEAQLAVYVGGELVLDLASNASPDALTTVYSVSKALSAIALAKLVERGQLDLDQKVAHYWPEFAAQGKQDVTVRQMLSHQAGIPETTPLLTTEQFLDDHAAAAALAAEKPWWRPGTGHGYHALSIGPLFSELCFRVSGKTIQQFYDSEVRVPAGADAYLGLPEELEPRVLELQPMRPPTPEQLQQWARPANWRPGPIGVAQSANGLGDAHVLSKAGRRFGLASAAGVASARGLASVFQWATGYGKASGGIAPEVLEEFSQVQASGHDLVLDIPTRTYGVVFMKPHPMHAYGSRRAFGHDGAAGSMLFADPEGEIVLGYTIRRGYFPGGMDPRLYPLLDEIRLVATGKGSLG